MMLITRATTDESNYFTWCDELADADEVVAAARGCAASSSSRDAERASVWRFFFSGLFVWTVGWCFRSCAPGALTRPVRFVASFAVRSCPSLVARWRRRLPDHNVYGNII